MEADRLVDAYGDVTVRDLAWLLFSPDLLRASHAGAPLAHPFETLSERDATLDWLAALDRAPSALHERARNPKLTRLGFYAESLLEYFLTHGPAASLVAANVPLRRQRVTIGEFDFLLQTARGVRLHWELAVKFYLHIGDGSAATARLSDYVGPNLQDRFDLKHERLLTHQLALTSRAEFASLGFDGPWEPQLYIKGRLFYHDVHGDSVTPAPELGDAHLRGWWRTVSEWGALHAESGDAWVVQPRMAWLASRRLAASSGEAQLADAATIRERLSSIVSPTMIAAYGRAEDGEFVERSRGFIVPDDWPERAREFALTTI